MADRVHIIGASGRSGIALSRSLVADHVSLVPIVRDHAKWHSAGIAVAARHADLTEATQLRDALGQTATPWVVSGGAIQVALPARSVVILRDR